MGLWQVEVQREPQEGAALVGMMSGSFGKGDGQQPVGGFHFVRWFLLRGQHGLERLLAHFLLFGLVVLFELRALLFVNRLTKKRKKTFVLGLDGFVGLLDGLEAGVSGSAHI